MQIILVLTYTRYHVSIAYDAIVKSTLVLLFFKPQIFRYKPENKTVE